MTEREEQALEVRRDRARALRYKKPIISDMNWESIMVGLSDIEEDCGDVRWMSEDDEELLRIFGDEDDVEEFRMAYTDLAVACEQLRGSIDEVSRMQIGMLHGWDEEEPPLWFDLFFPAIGGGSYMGYDEYEEDWFDLMGYEAEAARKEAAKKLCRLTKTELIDCAGLCFAIAKNWMSVRYRYDCLEAALRILRGENEKLVKITREISEAYEEAVEKTEDFRWDFCDTSRLDAAIREVPDRAWIE